MKTSKIDQNRDHRGRFPAFTSVGSYTVIYLGGQLESWNPDYSGSEVFCANCVNDPELSGEIVACDVYWEGPAMSCDGCQDDIESSYGDPEGNE